MEFDKLASAVAWPLALVVVLLIFRKPIIELIGKIKRVKGLGVEVDVPETQKVEAQEAQVLLKTVVTKRPSINY